MVARLASLPLRLRAKEIRAVLVMGAAVGVVLIAMWATTPSAQRPVRLEGTIVRLSASLASRYEPTQAVIEVELPDHRRTSLMTNYSRVASCKVGDRLRLVSLHSLAGATMLEVVAPACR
jgi:hypothetical protein